MLTFVQMFVKHQNFLWVENLDNSAEVLFKLVSWGIRGHDTS